MNWIGFPFRLLLFAVLWLFRLIFNPSSVNKNELAIYWPWVITGQRFTGRRML